MNVLLSTFKRMAFPNRWLQQKLNNFNVDKPGIDWRFLNEQCPWREYQNLARSIQPRFADADPFTAFGGFVEESTTVQRRWIDIRDIYGISASKSHIVPLKKLSSTINMDRMFANRTVADCIEEVLHGKFDCVAKAGDPVQIIEQQWDKRLYALNSGGSHRFSALWRWHWENNKPCMMDCSVRTVCISPETLRAITQTQYWLLEASWKTSYQSVVLDEIFCDAGSRALIPDRWRTGRIKARGVNVWLPQLKNKKLIDCVACPREHPMAQVVQEWLGETHATDLSAVITRIAASLPANFE